MGGDDACCCVIFLLPWQVERVGMEFDMPTKTMARNVVALNYQGIILLMESNVDAAIACFTEALSCTRKLAHCQCRDQKVEERSVQESPHPSCMMARTLVVESLGARDLTLLPHEHFNMYERAFVLGNDFEPLAECTLSIAILLYNLAFAYHCKGTGQAIQQALRYYKLGLKVIRDSLPSPANVDLLLVTLAILNNMGHVFSLLSQFHDSATCGERIHFLLESSIPTFLARQDEEFFHFMEFYLEQNDPLATAAAA